MIHFIPAPYKQIDGCSNVFINNMKIIQGRPRIWRYVFDYDVEQPKLDPVPIKLKSSEGLSLFRYMNESHFLSDLNAQQLTFISPKLWNDPFERLFYADGGVVIGNAKYYIRCICLTYDWIESEEAAWNRGLGGNAMVRVEYDFQKLCDVLESQSKNYDFYFSVIDYSLPRRDIIQLSKLYPVNSLQDYLNLLSLKRKAFVYENEIRLFMVSNSPIPQDVISINYSNQPISSVCLPPQQTELTRVETTANINRINVIHSRLYDVE